MLISVYCSQILGYTGTVSNAELEELGEGYESNDIVGKSGIEKSMESELSGVKGEKSVYVDTVGRNQMRLLEHLCLLRCKLAICPYRTYEKPPA